MIRFTLQLIAKPPPRSPDLPGVQKLAGLTCPGQQCAGAVHIERTEISHSLTEPLRIEYETSCRECGMEMTYQSVCEPGASVALLDAEQGNVDVILKEMRMPSHSPMMGRQHGLGGYSIAPLRAQGPAPDPEPTYDELQRSRIAEIIKAGGF